MCRALDIVQFMTKNHRTAGFKFQGTQETEQALRDWTSIKLISSNTAETAKYKIPNLATLIFTTF